MKPNGTESMPGSNNLLVLGSPGVLIVYGLFNLYEPERGPILSGFVSRVHL